MASIKRCDLCKGIWDPDDHADWNGVDTNRCSLSMDVPYNRMRPHGEGKEYRRVFETCQDCARAVIKTIEGLSVKPA